MAGRAPPPPLAPWLPIHGPECCSLSLSPVGLPPPAPPCCRAGKTPVLPQYSWKRSPGHPWGVGGAGGSRHPSAVGCPPPTCPREASGAQAPGGALGRAGAAPPTCRPPQRATAGCAQAPFICPGNTEQDWSAPAGFLQPLPALRSGKQAVTRPCLSEHWLGELRGAGLR